MIRPHDMTRPQTDKHDLHFQQQLSAMLDGELAPDQAKFMLRRLQHDGELAACWERWQVCGDILRGRHDALLPRDFSQRVARAIADENGTMATAAAAARVARQPKWARWGGGAALAASVAMAALFVVRQPAGPAPATPAAPAQVAANTAPPPETPSRPATPAPDTPSTTAALATVAVVAEVPRRAAQRRSRSQDQRAAARIRRQAEAPVLVAVNAPEMPATTQPGGDDTVALSVASQAPAEVLDPALAPFVAQPLPSRPWPRAILPEFRDSGPFSASYGTPGASATHPFHPFEPRVELLAPPPGDPAAADDRP